MLAKLLAPFKSGEKKTKEKVVKKTEKKEEVCLTTRAYEILEFNKRSILSGPR